MRRLIAPALAALLALSVLAMPAGAATFTQSPVTVQGGVDSFYPDSQGWNVSGLLHHDGVSVAGTMDSADRADTNLSVVVTVEFTAQANGSSGWQTLVGATWGGGLGRDGVTVHDAPTFGPYQTSNWSALDMKRLRIRVNPSRTVNNMGWSLSSN